MGLSSFPLTRRGFLKLTTSSASVLAAPLPVLAKPSVTSLRQYQREFFNADEWTFLLAATARLIPSTGSGPGALETRVPVFIDRQLTGDFGNAATWYMDGPHMPDAPAERGYQSPLTPAEVYRAGIGQLNQWCQDHHGTRFAKLDGEVQDEVLTALEKGNLTLSATQGADFFALLLQNTKEGYFSDPMYGGNHDMAAWAYIGFPGARAGYREWTSMRKAYPLGPVSISGKRA